MLSSTAIRCFGQFTGHGCSRTRSSCSRLNHSWQSLPTKLSHQTAQSYYSKTSQSITRSQQQVVQGTQGLIRPLVPGFQMTLSSRYFYRNRSIAALFNTLRFHLRLVLALQIVGDYQECFILKACDSFRLAFRRSLTEAYTSTWRCCSGRNWTNFGAHKVRQKTTPN